VNELFNPIDPIEKWLDANIESNNIWWYILGFIGIAIYFVLF